MERWLSAGTEKSEKYQWKKSSRYPVSSNQNDPYAASGKDVITVKVQSIIK